MRFATRADKLHVVSGENYVDGDGIERFARPARGVRWAEGDDRRVFPGEFLFRSARRGGGGPERAADEAKNDNRYNRSSIAHGGIVAAIAPIVLRLSAHAVM